MLIELIIVDVLMGEDEDVKYYCEEFWLMEIIFVINVSYVDIIFVFFFGMNLSMELYDGR